MPLRAEQSAALATIERWFALHKCHRLDQVLMDDPTFAHYIAQEYNEATLSNAPIPGKAVLASEMIRKDVPGFVDAVLALDRDRTTQGPGRFIRRDLPGAAQASR